MKKLDVKCTVCGSNQITADANAHWDVDTQEWTLGQVWEKGAYCAHCEQHDARYDFKEVK